MASIIGIDNGLDGGIAIYDGPLPKFAWVMAMPTLSHKKIRKPGQKTASVTRTYDEIRIRDFLKTHDFSTVYIEKVQAIPVKRMNPKTGKLEIVKQPAMAGITKGFQYGYIVGLCRAFSMPYHVVPPRTWQAEMLKGTPTNLDTKARSIIAAQRWFPTASLLRTDKCKKPHDGMADAMLIAEYGRRQQGVTV